MDNHIIPQHSNIFIDGLTFFSDFDSGNLNRASKVGQNQYELYVAADASDKGFNNYRVWFHFGIKGLRKGNFFKLTIMNLSNFRLMAAPSYRPVWRSIPSQPEWQRIPTDSSFEASVPSCFKLSFVFEMNYMDNDLYFAFAPPYPYCEVAKSINSFQDICPIDSIFYREIITRSIDGRDVELITISNRENFTTEREDRLYPAFLTQEARCYKPAKPVIFISARVHPGETPGSFMLDGFLKALLAQDRRGFVLRKFFVFKIIPILNPDGVYRGHFRVDQNGNNLNRYYITPTQNEHPTIYAAKTYVEYLNSISTVAFYLDFHAHVSRRGCFLFGNYLEIDQQVENELFAKLMELNSPFFDFSECDFSEKSMTAKDPKDQHSKEGCGRVALHKSIGIIRCYTVEGPYHVARPLHTITPLINIKVGRRHPELPIAIMNQSILVYNRYLFDDLGSAIAASILDTSGLNPLSRVPSTEYKCIETLKEFISSRINLQRKRHNLVTRSSSKTEIEKTNKSNPKQILPKVTNKVARKLPIISPILSERVATSFSLQKSNQKLATLPPRRQTTTLLKYHKAQS